MKFFVFCVVLFAAVAAFTATETDTENKEKEETNSFPQYLELGYNNDYSEEANNDAVESEEKIDYIEKQVLDEKRAYFESEKAKNDKPEETDTENKEKEETSSSPHYLELDYNNDYSEEANNDAVESEEKIDYLEKQVLDEKRAYFESEKAKKDKPEEFDALMDYVLEDNRLSTNDKEEKLNNNVTQILSENDFVVTNPELKFTSAENKEDNDDTDAKILNDWWSADESEDALQVPELSKELSKEIKEEVVDDNAQQNEEESIKSVSIENVDPDLDQIMADTIKLLEKPEDFDVSSEDDDKTNENIDNEDALEINQEDETPETVLKDLNSDLDELLEALDKMTKDDSDIDKNDDIINDTDGVDDVQDNENKNETTDGESYILSLRDDYENFLNSNLSEIFSNMNVSADSEDLRDIEDIIAEEIADIEAETNQAVTSNNNEEELETTTTSDFDTPDYPHEIDYSSILPTDYSDYKEITDDTIKHYYGNDGLIDKQITNEDAEIFLTTILEELAKTVPDSDDSVTDSTDTEIIPGAETEDDTSPILNEEVPTTTEATRATLMVDDLNSSEYNELMSQFAATHKDELAINSEIVPTRVEKYTLKLDEATVIQSPNYPGNYPSNTVIDYIFDGPGIGIEMNVTDLQISGAQQDYLLVKPGGVDHTGTDGLIFSFRLSSVRKYRFLSVNRMFARFHSHAWPFGKYEFSVKMILPLPGIADDEPEPEPVLQAPKETFTVSLAGVTVIEFNNTRQQFKELIADMAEEYIKRNGIYPGLNSTLEVTQITRTAVCNIRWPKYETCVEVTFGVPLHYDEEVDDPKLDAEDLSDMWKTYIVKESYASRFKDMGLWEYPIPDSRSVLIRWLVIAAGVVVAMALLGFAMWRFSCFEDYTRMKAFNDTESIENEKRIQDLYPTPHQTIPPLYSDSDYKWADDKYDESARVDMGGFTNKSYIRDELFDFDSDEDDILSTHDRKGVRISSKNVFDA